MKRFFSLIFVLALSAALLLPGAAAERKTKYLVLGDSIAAGYGILNPDEASYGRIVADTNGFDYVNLARVAMDSYELLDLMENGARYDPAAGRCRNVTDIIADSDLISISIGANDYFDAPDWEKLLVKALFRLNNAELDAIAENYYANLCRIIDGIRAVNPDAPILLQTVYCVWYGFAANANRACSSRVNAMIERYDREHPGQILICDIAPAMEHKPENLADDSVHPNARGNVAIAGLVLLRMKELGLGENTEPVVNAGGEDWNYYETAFDDEKTAKLVTMLIKLLTGNGVNILRK